MKTLLHHGKVYQKFISTSIQVESSFRTSYILIILMDFFFFASTLASVHFIYDHVEHIGPWPKEQFLFFISFVLLVDNLHMILVSQNFWELSFMIRTGEFDYLLLKPTHSLFNAFFRHFRSSSLFNTPLALYFMIKYGNAIALGPLDWLLLPLCLLLGITLLFLVEFCLSCAMFWMVEGMGVNFLRMQLQSLARWPSFVYSHLYRKIFTLVVPIVLVGTAPVQFLYDKSQWFPLAQLCLLILVFYGLLIFLWKKGLKRYDSASS